jgi:sarcosine oxidase gamma subunit
VAIDASHLHVVLDETIRVGSLRYFGSTSRFAEAMQAALAATLPSTLKAVISSPDDSESLIALAWRSPTEALLLTDSVARFEQIEAVSETHQDGCFVDQTHGLCVLRAGGEQLLDLLSRLGGNDLFPLLGDSKRGRLAEVPVLTLKVQPKETLLVVERTYVDHLMDWIQETAVDLHLVTVPPQ